MAENRAGLEEGKSWRMLTDRGEKSKLDKNHMFYLVEFCTGVGRWLTCLDGQGGSVIRGLPTISQFRAEWESSESLPHRWLMGDIHFGLAEAPQQGFSKSMMHEHY